jgi:nucleotide-binding universal stress UspA family protein
MKTLDVGTRIQLKNILFTTDFSHAADAAAPYAAELAKRYGANLYALHVRPPVIYPMTPPESWKGLEEAARIVAEHRKSELLDKFTGVQTEVLINEGDLWSNVAAAIEGCNIDLIVLGTRGRSGIGKLLLGSTAEEIFRQAPCPVLTVGPHAPSEPKRGGEFSRILFATDFSPESVAAAPYAISLAQECQAHLTLMHVLAEPKAGDHVHPSELAGSSAQLLRNLVPPEAELWCVPEYVVERGVAAEKILEVAAQSKVDLIVLGVRRPSGFPGAATHLPIAIAHKVVSDAACPVLTVRRLADSD